MFFSYVHVLLMMMWTGSRSMGTTVVEGKLLMNARKEDGGGWSTEEEDMERAGMSSVSGFQFDVLREQTARRELTEKRVECEYTSETLTQCIYCLSGASCDCDYIISARGEGITGTIPSRISLCADISTIRLYETGVTGTIPSELGDMSLIDVMYVFLYGHDTPRACAYVYVTIAQVYSRECLPKRVHPF